MGKLLILLVSMASLAAAGVLDPRWVVNRHNDRINEIIRDQLIEKIDNDPIMQMSSDELLRQKFILKVLEHVQQPMVDEELHQIYNALLVDQNNYKGGIDEDIENIIDLCRNLRILGKNEIFSISNPDHMRQMVALQRLLVRARDWETFQKNVCYARKHVNGVLFVNALLLALRERDDTRMLVVPGIYEILPEMYLSKDVVHTARNIDLNLLTQTTDRDTMRPNLFDMIGLGGRNDEINMNKNRGEGVSARPYLWMPWRERRIQMAMQKTRNNKNTKWSDVEDKIVIPVEKHIDIVRDASLLTEDVGLKSFVHLMMADICLRESELQHIRSRDRLGVNQNIIMNIPDRERNAKINENWNRLNIRNDDRMLGRRLSIDSDRLIRRENDEYGHHVINWQDEGRLGNLYLEQPDDRIRGSQREQKIGQDWGSLNERSRYTRPTDVLNNLPTTTSDDERLLHVNQRRLSSTKGNNYRNDEREINVQDRLMNIIHGSRIHDSRRVAQSSYDNRRVSPYEELSPYHDIGSSQFNRWHANREDNEYITRGQSTVDSEDLPTTTIDDERLLHINRRRLLSSDNAKTNDFAQKYPQNARDRFVSILHGTTVHDSRQRSDENARLIRKENNRWEADNYEMNSHDDIEDQRLLRNRNERYRNIDSSTFNKNRNGMLLSGQFREEDNLRRTSTGDKRSFQVNHRSRLAQEDDFRGDDEIQGYRNRVSDMHRIRDENIRSQGRQGMWNKDLTDEERLIGIRKANVESDRLLHINRRHWNNDDDESAHDVRHRRVREARSTTENNVQWDKGTGVSSDVLLHNLKQLLARIEIDKISLGFGSNAMSNYETGNYRLDQGRMLNGMKTNQVSVELIAQIENIIQHLLDDVDVERDESEPVAVDRKIADVLMGQKENINVINLIQYLIVNANPTSRNQQSLQDVAIDLGNPLFHTLLQGLNKALDNHRTKLLGTYTQKDLGLDGVIINDIKADDLKTSVDQSDVDIFNLLDNHISLRDTYHKMIVAREQRLNHKEFAIKIDLDSDRNRRVLVRTMLGPKITDHLGQELTLEERRNHFVLIDTNAVDLKAGKNVIKIKSRDIVWTSRDTTPLTKIYERVMVALDTRNNAEGVMPITDIIGQNCRFPHRLLLPRGRVDGLKMELLVIVTPLESNVLIRKDVSCAMGVGTITSDGNSIGFPLDRRIDNIREWMNLPNLGVIDVIIRHDNMKTHF